MDRPSLVGTLNAVIKICGGVVSRCYLYRSGDKNASSMLTRMRDEVMGLREVVKGFSEMVETDNASDDVPNLQAIAGADGPLNTCLLELTAIEASLKAGYSLHAPNMTLDWPMKEGDMLKSIDVLARIKKTLQLAVAPGNA